MDVQNVRTAEVKVLNGVNGHAMETISIANSHKFMSQSLLDRHLKSAIAIQQGVAVPVSTVVQKNASKKRKLSKDAEPSTSTSKRNKEGRNYLDEARKEQHGKKKNVQSILELLGKKDSAAKKFSKRRLKSIIKVQHNK